MSKNQTPALDTFGWKVYNAVVLTVMWAMPATVIVLCFLGIIR